MPAIGHLRGGREDLADLAAGVEDGRLETGEAGAGSAAGTGGGTDCATEGGGAYGIGMAAGGGGCGKASFFRIITSQSNCFNCSSTISLESTSLQAGKKMLYHIHVWVILEEKVTD